MRAVTSLVADPFRARCNQIALLQYILFAFSCIMDKMMYGRITVSDAVEDETRKEQRNIEMDNSWIIEHNDRVKVLISKGLVTERNEKQESVCMKCLAVGTMRPNPYDTMDLSEFDYQVCSACGNIQPDTVPRIKQLQTLKGRHGRILDALGRRRIVQVNGKYRRLIFGF